MIFNHLKQFKINYNVCECSNEKHMVSVWLINPLNNLRPSRPRCCVSIILALLWPVNVFLFHAWPLKLINYFTTVSFQKASEMKFVSEWLRTLTADVQATINCILSFALRAHIKSIKLNYIRSDLYRLLCREDNSS